MVHSNACACLCASVFFISTHAEVCVGLCLHMLRVRLQGKSLSVICGAQRWLEDCEKRDREKVEKTLTGPHATTDTLSSKQQNCDNGIYICTFRYSCVYIRESVHSLCRDDADMPMPPYI